MKILSGKQNLQMLKLLVIMLLMYSVLCWVSWPSASFESSDDGWSDSEILLKDRDLDSMAYFFELYKIQCDVNNAVLVRTTEINVWNIFYWPSYLLDAKWKVPYRSQAKNISNKKCFDKQQSEEIVNQAIVRSNNYIESL